MEKKRYEIYGPSGKMVTMATSEAKAWANFRYRLVKECGMSWYSASSWDHSDLKAVD